MALGTGDMLLRGNPAMDKHSVEGGVATLLGMPHANETEISSGRLSLWLVCVFTFLPKSYQIGLI